ncbi:leucine-rich repeat LGI family member 2 [Rissa tridactyla]|uniref:leucine-rich repeat LGI family member 2 n=1 Tax=Rissa tridactyla TaxID=75485 RepID=UPI0023BA5A88|nr:leucine-rich repeat LGI family member 2 [Rissa tridactyla]
MAAPLRLLSFATAVLILLLLLPSPAAPRRPPRCSPPCSCWRESALCVGAAGAPRSLPAGLGSLSLVNGTFSEVKDRMFSHLPSLQLLLLNSNSFTVIRDDAFAGLFHLEYLFIEGNKIETISRNAFRGLRDLTHLSLANNHLKTLPRDVFSDLDSLIELDLRGNKFECDCKAKWLFLWLKMTNSTVSDVLCIGPAEYQDKKLNDVTSFDYECTTTDFVVHQILPYQSVSVDTFNSKNDVFVAIAQPSMENCMVLEWDHIEMNFRSYDNITGQSIVGCKAILVGDQVFVVVAQLFGGSHIYKYDESWTKFVKFQDIEVSRISKPNDIELFEIDSEMFFVIADSSKAGLSTVYKWNNKGFYSYQSLHEWFRDTDAEFLDIDGKSHLILSSRSQVPIILQWNKASKKFVPHSEIPNMEDVLAVKSFRMQDSLYITLTRFIGDSRVMKWNSKQFVEIQALPSRGAMTLQPFSFKNNYYLALGSDYTFSQIYQWDGEKKIFRLFKEIYVQAPRSFTAVSTDRRDFFFASSFKGNTQIFEHIVIDLSL